MTELVVHLRVNDAGTGQPTPCRFCIYDERQHFYAPNGRCVDFPLYRAEAVGGQVAIAGKRWFVIDGACEIALPTGVPLTIEIGKGILFAPVVKTFTLGAGQMALRFAIERKIEAKDHFFVDTRSHFLTPHDALLEAEAEGLDSVQLLITEQMMPGQDGKLYPTAANLSAFSGQKPCLERNGTSLYVNTLNSHPALGKVGLLNSHRPIFPLAFGEFSDDWSLADWCDQCHRKKGFTVWVDALTEPVKGGEALVDAILGKIDAIELNGSPHDAARLKMVYHLWNLGVPINIVGGSGKVSNRKAIGSYRTGIRILSQSQTDWMHYLTSGWTYATSGPIIHQELNDGVSEAQTYVCKVESIQAFENLEIIASGESLSKVKSEIRKGLHCAEQTVVNCQNRDWLAARVTGRQIDPLYGALPFAHSSPVVVGAAVDPIKRRLASETLAPAVHDVRDWVADQGRFQQERRRQFLLDLCDEALRRLETP